MSSAELTRGARCALTCLLLDTPDGILCESSNGNDLGIVLASCLETDATCIFAIICFFMVLAKSLW